MVVKPAFFGSFTKKVGKPISQVEVFIPIYFNKIIYTVSSHLLRFFRHAVKLDQK